MVRVLLYSAHQVGAAVGNSAASEETRPRRDSDSDEVPGSRLQCRVAWKAFSSRLLVASVEMATEFGGTVPCEVGIINARNVPGAPSTW